MTLKKLVFPKSCSSKLVFGGDMLWNKIPRVSCFGKKFQEFHASERNSESLLLFLFHGTEFRVVFSFAEWFGIEFQVFRSEFLESIFVLRYRILSNFLVCGMVWNGIPRVFCSVEQPEFCQNKLTILAIPSSLEYFFAANCQPCFHENVRHRLAMGPTHCLSYFPLSTLFCTG